MRDEIIEGFNKGTGGIKAGSGVSINSVTIPEDGTLDNSGSNTNFVIGPNAKITNNGMLIVNSGDLLPKGLGGSGWMKQGGNYYLNNRTQIINRSESLDLINPNVADHQEKTLANDGYTFSCNAANGYTLTLGNLIIETDNEASISLPTDGDVTIILADGTTTRLTSGNKSALYARANGDIDKIYNHTITGNGKLELESASNDGTLDVRHNLTIKGGSIVITNKNDNGVGLNCSREDGEVQPTLNINGGKLSINANKRAIQTRTEITLGRGVKIKSPEGAVLGEKDSAQTILEKDSATVAKSVEIVTPTVASVTVEPASARIPRNDPKQFTAKIAGIHNPAQTVTWSVEGGSAGTAIDEKGVLTIAANETATTLTVKATSTVDTTKFATATVTIPTVGSVMVEPATASIIKGGSQQFTAGIVGEHEPDATVIWSVEGGIAGTSIDASGKLTVAATETATTLTVKATSTQDAAKFDTATVTVLSPEPSYIPDYNDPLLPVTVYNHLMNHRATIALTGVGLKSSDLLITESDPQGSAYQALKRLAENSAIFGTYNIYLRSGQKSTGEPMYLSFDLDAEYAGQDFTLVHRKADGTYEYFYDTADANGNLSFGPLYELSPFLLVKGTLSKAVLPEVPDVTIDDIPKTGDSAQTAALAGVLVIGLAALAGLALRRRRRG